MFESLNSLSNGNCLLIAIGVLTALYFYLTRNYNYWSSRGVKGPKPWPLIGTAADFLTKPMHEVEEERIKKYGLISGAYEGTKPTLRVADPELIKNIMVKDFHVFVNRRIMDMNDPILSRALTQIRDDDWKRMRSIVSPTFSTGKMRKMHKLVEDCVCGVEEVLTTAAQNKSEIELKKLMGDYSMEVIGKCAFGTKIDTHKDPNNPFVRYAIRVFRMNQFRILFLLAFPFLVKMFKIPILDPEVSNFFKNVTQSIMRRRNEHKEQHHDFLQLMMNAQKKNNINDHDDDDGTKDAEAHHGYEDNSDGKKSMTDNDVAITENDILATSFIFFLAGYETTASLLSYLFYSLALNQHTQQLLLNEIIKNEDSNGVINYETIAKMPYLDACISETLRLYNPAITTERTASEDYTLGDTGIVVPKGMIIQIPIHGIHHSEEFYTAPHQFNPERFMPENRDKIIPYTYLPFGAGPRNCVGMRFALMEAKTLIVHIIRKYKFVRSENTNVPLKFAKFARLMQPKDITVGVEMRN